MSRPLSQRTIDEQNVGRWRAASNNMHDYWDEAIHKALRGVKHLTITHMSVPNKGTTLIQMYAQPDDTLVAEEIVRWDDVHAQRIAVGHPSRSDTTWMAPPSLPEIMLATIALLKNTQEGND